ncbi:MAG TPA: hypothetical protein VFJ94_10705 [Intrasporangium sp.]|uniref:hypothetical protein n=1 Tax=Intrasporangium sp. TaxID=1925024 RepID=UPI002D76BE60|nr:hypothetical protein [Intrasporangium sp.]HET7398980.1 hypothetical protein [Intrasporangium sp.]
MTEQTADTSPTDTTPTDAARDSLATIRKGWRHVLNPMQIAGGGSTRDTPRPATEDEIDYAPDARLDTPRTLAFWVHAAVDEWPGILDRPERVPQPTTDEDAYPAWTIHMRTITVDCGDVYDMLDLLEREVDRLATWVDGTHDFGATFVTEVDSLARAVSRVAWPPKGDRMTIGDCPACGRRIRVKPPEWRRVPQPTTDPDTYPMWSWRPERDKPITCRCGAEETLEGWRERMAGPSLLLTAEQIVTDVREQLGMRYTTAAVRQWSRRGLIASKGYSKQGHALYDRTQVLAALMAREKERAS